MESQDIRRIEGDISDIKKAMGQLVSLITEVSLHNGRLERLEGDAQECSADRRALWKSLREIHDGCLKRDAVYQDAKLFFSRRKDKMTMQNPDEWFTILLGGALRNGVWIAISALITAVIMRQDGG